VGVFVALPGALIILLLILKSSQGVKTCLDFDVAMMAIQRYTP